MNATIIFGTKKLGQKAVETASEKYPNQAVITVEGQKGAKKSRRILMNTKAAELLGATVGETQEFVFASVEMGENVPNQVLIANASTIDSEVDVTYRSSKNKVSYGEDSSEKGKAITSSHACNEIFTFLDLDDSSNVEFELNPFPAKELEAFSLDTVSAIKEPVPVTSDELADVSVIETNSGELSGAELQNSVQAEVARAEEANPVLDTDEAPAIEEVEETKSKTSTEDVLVASVDNEWM